MALDTMVLYACMNRAATRNEALIGTDRIRSSVLGMDPYWWEGDLKLTVDRNPGYVGSMNESIAAVSGSCGDPPAPLATVPMDPPAVKLAADRDPNQPLAKAAPATVDPQSFDRWLLQ
jgi:hypothetical protein